MPSQQHSISLRDVYRILFRHRRKSMATILLIAGVGVAIALVMPRTYRSESKLFVRLGRENVGLDPTATMGQASVVAIPQSREAEINSVVEIVRSRALREMVVDTLGAAYVLEKPTHEAAATASEPTATAETDSSWTSWLKQYSPLTSQSDRERALARMEKSLDVEAIRNSDVVVITFEANNPEVAQRVLGELTRDYLNEHMRLNRTAGAHDFLDEQAKRLRSDLKQAEGELTQLKNKTGLISPAAQRQLVVARIGRLEDELLAATSQAAASRREVTELRAKLAELSPTQTTAETTGLDNKAADSMREQLYLLEVREREMAAKYTDAHPELQRVREQLVQAKKIHDDEKGARTTKVVGPNRAYEETHLSLLRQEPVLASLEARVGALQSQLADSRQEVQLLNDNELRIATLDREVQLQDASYRRYSDSLEQAKIDQSLKEDGISNISMIQPASLNPQPVRPKVLLTLLAAIGGALVAGIGLALVCEYLDHTFKTPEEVESLLDLPLLVSIPEISRRHLIFNGRTAGVRAR